jgi:hypothetical protein
MIFKSAVSKLNKYIYVGVILFLLFLTIPAFFEDSYEPFLVLFSIHFLLKTLIYIGNRVLLMVKSI